MSLASQSRERPLLTLLKQGASFLPSSPFCPHSPFLLRLCSALQKERKESAPPSGYPACLPVSSPLQPPFCISLGSYIALSNSQVSPSSKRAVAGGCPFGVMAVPLGATWDSLDSLRIASGQTAERDSVWLLQQNHCKPINRLETRERPVAEEQAPRGKQLLVWAGAAM